MRDVNRLLEAGLWVDGWVVTVLVKKADPSVCAHLASWDSESAPGCLDSDGFQTRGQHELGREPEFYLGWSDCNTFV